MAGLAKASKWLFLAGCFLLALGVVIGGTIGALAMRVDMQSLLSRFLFGFSMYAIVGGTLLTFLGTIFFCVCGDPKALRDLGFLAALGGILCVSANLHDFNVHSGPALYAIVGAFVVFLGASMACVSWIRLWFQSNKIAGKDR